MRVLLITVLILTCSMTSFAQDSYEYAVASYWPFKGKIFIYKDGQTDERKGVKAASTVDPTPLLLEIDKLNEEGWEVYSSNAEAAADNMVGCSYYYFLRKKK